MFLLPVTVISIEEDAQPALLIAMQEYLPLSEVRTFSITRVLLVPNGKMLALAFTGIPFFVHRISLVASFAWQVSESRSPSNREGCGFEDIVIIGFSEDRMQP